MVVICKVKHCAYNIAGFCTKETLDIDENGMCGSWWFRGQPRLQREVPVGEKRHEATFPLLDGDWKEVIEDGCEHMGTGDDGSECETFDEGAGGCKV